MKASKVSENHLGSSLLGVLVASTIMSILATGIAELGVSASRISATAQRLSDFQSRMNGLHLLLSDPAKCREVMSDVRLPQNFANRLEHIFPARTRLFIDNSANRTRLLAQANTDVNGINFRNISLRVQGDQNPDGSYFGFLKIAANNHKGLGGSQMAHEEMIRFTVRQGLRIITACSTTALEPPVADPPPASPTAGPVELCRRNTGSGNVECSGTADQNLFLNASVWAANCIGALEGFVGTTRVGYHAVSNAYGPGYALSFPVQSGADWRVTYTIHSNGGCNQDLLVMGTNL